MTFSFLAKNVACLVKIALFYAKELNLLCEYDQQKIEFSLGKLIKQLKNYWEYKIPQKRFTGCKQNKKYTKFVRETQASLNKSTLFVGKIYSLKLE